MLIRKMFRTAWNYKSQFISMVIMVAIGTGIFLGFNIEWKSIETDAFSFLKNTNYADFRIYSEKGFTENDIDKIQDIAGVDEATRYFSVNVSLKDKAKKDSKKQLALNVSEEYNVSTMQVMEGEPYNDESNGIWLSDKFAEANDIDLGDKLTLTYSGVEITEKVVGLGKSGENMVCVADGNQLMPDYKSFGFAYVTPKTLENALGKAFYPQIYIISSMEKEELEEAIKDAIGTTVMVSTKDDHISYAGAASESEEGKTMGAILPVLFLAIGILTMVTTMHRIAANEKVQIGTLKALGFRDKKILLHYTSYGFFIGLVGILLGVGLGYLIGWLVMNPNGMMGTYLDMPQWKLVMPRFCIPVMLLMLALLTLISFYSVRENLKGTAAEALRAYRPKKMKKSVFERLKIWKKLSFGIKWNTRDILRHKSRSAMTLLGVIGCTVLIVGSLGMKDTMVRFLDMMDEDVCKYETKIIMSENTSKDVAMRIVDEVDGDWQSSQGISYEGKTVVLDIYNSDVEKIGFLTEKNDTFRLSDDGVYLSLRLKETADIGDTIEFSPYGSSKTYEAKVAGYFRSVINESVSMTDKYAKKIGIGYSISNIYTLKDSDSLDKALNTQEKETLMDSYDSFMLLMNMMVFILIVAAIILGVVVLYNLGVMSYIERSHELATLKVLGFKDKRIGKLLITQNAWLTLIGVIIGIPAGYFTLKILVVALASEYELSTYIGAFSYMVSALLVFGTSLLVGLMVSRKNKKIDMVEALKDAE